MTFFTEDNVRELNQKLRGRVVKDVELVGDGIGINIAEEIFHFEPERDCAFTERHKDKA